MTSASMRSTEITLRVANSLADVEPAAWDACANPPVADAETASETEYNPFISHDFLSALERSGSARGRTPY